MNNYKSFAELKEELGNNYDFKLYEMGISALKEIENLQQEKSQLKGSMETYDILLKSNVEENKQLKDNRNKLREYLEKSWTESQDIWFVKIINKMQELQGSDSNV